MSRLQLILRRFPLLLRALATACLVSEDSVLLDSPACFAAGHGRGGDICNYIDEIRKSRLAMDASKGPDRLSHLH
jgi:hypothetical protein